MSNAHEQFDLSYAVDEHVVDELILQNEGRLNALHARSELGTTYLALLPGGHGQVDTDGFQTPEDMKMSEMVIDRFRTYTHGTMRFAHDTDETMQERCWEIPSAEIFVVETLITKPDGETGALTAHLTVEAPKWYAEKIKTLQALGQSMPSYEDEVTTNPQPTTKRAGLLSKLGEAAANNPFGHGFGMRGLYNQQQVDKRRKDTE